MTAPNITPSVADRGIILVRDMSRADFADTVEAVTSGDVASLTTDAAGRVVGPPVATRQREIVLRIKH